MKRRDVGPRLATTDRSKRCEQKGTGKANGILLSEAPCKSSLADANIKMEKRACFSGVFLCGRVTGKGVVWGMPRAGSLVRFDAWVCSRPCDRPEDRKHNRGQGTGRKKSPVGLLRKRHCSPETHPNMSNAWVAKELCLCFLSISLLASEVERDTAGWIAKVRALGVAEDVRL